MLAVDPSNANTVHFGGIDAYKSINGGTTWTLLDNGVPDVAVFALALNSNLRVLRAATHGRGVFELNLGGTLPPKYPPRAYIPFAPK